MTPPQPEYINHEDLEARLHQEVAMLSGEDLEWWSVNRVSPFAALHGSASHFVVAVAGERILFFADDEDEFGVATLMTSHSMTNYGLVGDLRDAVRLIRTIAAR